MGGRTRAAVSTPGLAPGIAGVDEAGRGPLAGPVVAAAVVLAPRQRIAGARDSKRIGPEERERLAERIRVEAVAFAVGRAEVEEIDTLNILAATLLAMSRALAALPALPGRLHIDGDRAPTVCGYAGRIVTLVKGDQRCNAVASASILAKVSRDDEMRALDRRYPGYGFAQHKGYGTPEHRAALVRLGPCPVHRRSFAPVRLCLDPAPVPR